MGLKWHPCADEMNVQYWIPYMLLFSLDQPVDILGEGVHTVLLLIALTLGQTQSPIHREEVSLFIDQLPTNSEIQLNLFIHDDVIKWKHFPRYWSFVRGIHRSPVNSPHKGQWRGALMFSLNCAWINRWVNNREAGDLRRHRAHYDVIVMTRLFFIQITHRANLYLSFQGEIWSILRKFIIWFISCICYRHAVDIIV